MEKVRRNDPCPCGSGKKYKSCCLQKQQSRGSSLAGRKFTAKVISAGVANKVLQEQQKEQSQLKQIDYSQLMERSFGEALHSHEEKPPLPQNPSEYMVKEKNNKREDA